MLEVKATPQPLVPIDWQVKVTLDPENESIPQDQRNASSFYYRLYYYLSLCAYIALNYPKTLRASNVLFLFALLFLFSAKVTLICNKWMKLHNICVSEIDDGPEIGGLEEQAAYDYSYH